MEDAEILALFQARSEEAIRELERKYGRLLFTLAHRIVGTRQDAEECVNDAYLGVWNAIPPARPEPLLPYVCRVVRNLACKALRHRHAARRSSAYTVAMAELEPCLAGPDSAESAVAADELVRILESFLDALSAENRVIFLRRYWFADSCREIAARTELSEKAVTVRLTRLRQRLRDHLAEQGVFV